MFRLLTADLGTGAQRPLAAEGVCVREWTTLPGAVCARAYVGADWNWIVWHDVARFRFRQDSLLVEAIPEDGVTAARITDVYSRYVRPIVMQARGAEALHASAVSSPTGVVALCGDRGAGKSTVAFALSRRGLRHFADDVLALNVAADRVEAMSLPFEPRLRSAAASFFGEGPGRRPMTRDAQSDPPREPLAAVFVLEGIAHGTRQSPEITRLSEAAALEALLPHAHTFNPQDLGARKRQVQNYLEICARIPVFAVQYLYGLDRLDQLLDSLTEAAGITVPEALAVC